jgi:hypothetical protein
MALKKFTKLRRLNVATHRDLGYFFSTLIIVYSLSGIALNHVNDWNPDFIITKTKIPISQVFDNILLDKSVIDKLGKLAGEDSYKVYDVPSRRQVKIYYDNASFHVNFETHSGIYEKVARRPIFYHSNLLHRNSVKGWRYFSDVFAVGLVIISISGLFILKGKHGLSGRGKWLMVAGALVPAIFFFIHEFV